MILDDKRLGLLDSGAQISCIGGSLATDLCNKNNYRQHKTYISTADGNQQVVFANLKTNVSFKDKTETIDFYIVPSLAQDIILGVDFWKKFNLAPAIISEIDLVKDHNLAEYELHDMTTNQKLRLESVKSIFPSCEIEGLVKPPFWNMK